MAPPAVLVCPVEVTAESLTALEADVGRLLGADGTRLVLDLVQTNFLGSAGLGLFVKLGKRLQERGGGVALARARPTVQRLMRAVGLGPTAGVLAIAITYSGMLGKVYAEIFESVDQRPAHALLQAGSGRLTAFFYGILPTAGAEVVSYTVYRWECAVRASVVMGFVGAGGLGQQMDLSMRMFAGGEVASMLLTFLLLVFLADLLSRFLRGRFA